MGVSLLNVVPCLGVAAATQAPSTSSTSNGESSVACEGLLRYQSKQGKWKERWFVLDAAEYRLVKCRASSGRQQRSKDYNSAVGGVRIAEVHQFSTDSTASVATGFEVATTTGDRVRFLTATVDEERKWCGAIHKLSHGFTHGVTERLATRELLAGKYALVRELGRGASGVVSLYTYQGKPFAIKKFVPQKAKAAPNRLAVPTAGRSPPGSAASPSDIPEEVRREIALLRKASQLPYVIKLHDVIVDAEARQYYLVMEYMGGGAIAEWDPERKVYACAKNQKSLSLLDEKTVRVYMTNLLLGIQALHQNGLCHRDIKPENLMANEDKTQCKIGDLGIAHFFRHEANGALTEEANPEQIELWDLPCSSASRTSEAPPPPLTGEKAMLKTTKGTYQFLSPEALSGDAFDGFKADIWAIGVTLYALLFGYLPFYSNDLVKLFEKIERDPVVIPASCQDEDARDLLLKVLEKDPEKRITIAAMLEHKWLHRNVDSKALTHQVRALKRAPAICVDDLELDAAVSVLHSRFDQLSRAVRDNTLAALREDASTQRLAGVGDTTGYTPQPIALGGVELPAWMQTDLPTLAEQLHYDWCRAKHLDGWVFGEKRDDAARVHPLLQPMRHLPEDARLQNVQCVEETLKCVIALGCHVDRRLSRRARSGSASCGLLQADHVSLSWDMLMLVDLLAENSHEVWAVGYTAQGWQYGDVFDAGAKKHPSLKPYMALAEAEKNQCREGVSAVLRSCQCLGYEISCARSRAKSV